MKIKLLLLSAIISLSSCHLSKDYVDTKITNGAAYNTVYVETFIWRYGEIIASNISRGDDLRGIKVYDLPAELQKHEEWTRNTLEILRVSDSIQNNIGK